MSKAILKIAIGLLFLSACTSKDGGSSSAAAMPAPPNHDQPAPRAEESPVTAPLSGPLSENDLLAHKWCHKGNYGFTVRDTFSRDHHIHVEFFRPDGTLDRTEDDETLEFGDDGLGQTFSIRTPTNRSSFKAEINTARDEIYMYLVYYPDVDSDWKICP